MAKHLAVLKVEHSVVHLVDSMAVRMAHYSAGKSESRKAAQMDVMRAEWKEPHSVVHLDCLKVGWSVMLMVAQKAVRKVQWSAVQRDGPLVVEMAASKVVKWEARRAAN